MLQLALCNLLILGGLIKGTAFNECLLNSACSLYHWCWSRDTFKELPYVEWIRESTYIVNNSITIQALLSHNHWLSQLIRTMTHLFLLSDVRHVYKFLTFPTGLYIIHRSFDDSVYWVLLLPYKHTNKLEEYSLH